MMKPNAAIAAHTRKASWSVEGSNCGDYLVDPVEQEQKERPRQAMNDFLKKTCQKLEIGTI